MHKIFFILFSFLFTQYFNVGDQISIQDQNQTWPICYDVNNEQIEAQYPLNDIKLSNFNGDLNGGDYKIVVLRFSASWWTYCYTGIEVFDDLILSWGNNSNVLFLNHLYQPYQPYSCESWGDFGAEGIPLVFYGDTFTTQFVDLGFPLYVILDHTMTIRYRDMFPSTWILNNKINQYLSMLPPTIGDLNFDGSINIQDVILLVYIALNSSAGILPTEQELVIGDIYLDGEINIIDIVGLVNIILD